MHDKKKQLILAVLASATLGLAPFTPEPHVWKQIRLLVNGELTAFMDIFDLALHGAPWVFLVYALVSFRRARSDESR